MIRNDTSNLPSFTKGSSCNLMNYCSHESGRSLTEMMGTLAIMGILAIAGIWMYNSAMDKLKANTLINEAQKRAVVVAGQIGFQGRTDPSLEEFSDNTFAGGTFSTEVITNGLYQQFGIQVSGVSKNVCQNILNSVGDGSSIRRVTYVGGPTNALATCSDNNTFLMIYNNDMSTGGNDTEYSLTGCGCQTLCGQCVVENGTSVCVNECPAGSGSTCSANSDCQGDCVGCVKESGQTTGTCQACQRVAYLQSNKTQYIDTGITMTTDDLNFDLVVEFDSFTSSSAYSSAFGQNNNYQVCVGTTGKWGIGNAYSSKVAVTNHPYHVEGRLSTTASNSIYIADGESVNLSRATNKNTKQLLFTTANTSYNMAGKIYSFKAWRANALLRDFVPVHAPFKETGKQNCMFDQVTKALFCNAGTGNDFIIP